MYFNLPIGIRSGRPADCFIRVTAKNNRSKVFTAITSKINKKNSQNKF